VSEQPPADREEWIRWVREKLEREEAEKHEPPPNGHDPDAELLRQLRIDIGQLNCVSSPEEIAAIVDRIAAGIGDEIMRDNLLRTLKSQTKTSLGHQELAAAAPVADRSNAWANSWRRATRRFLRLSARPQIHLCAHA